MFPFQAAANELQVTGTLDASRTHTLLRMADGRTVTVPTGLLLGSSAAVGTPAPASAEVAPAGSERVIPLVAEELEVSKRTVTSGTVRLHRSTEAYTETASLDLTRTEWEIERVPIGEVLAQRPEVRLEGDTTIYPLVEERLVARREYLLVEEVRVRQVSVTTPRTASAELKRDVLTVERDPVPPGADL